MEVRKLSDSTGIDVVGIDMTASRTAEKDKELEQMLFRHGLICFRNQKFTKQQFCDAVEPFGGLSIGNSAAEIDPEAPGLTVISTRGERGDVVPPDPAKIVGDLKWHTDNGYIRTPIRARILYSVAVPKIGGKTGLIDGQLAYAALSDETKERIENLHVIQSWRHAEKTIAHTRDYRTDGHKLTLDRFPDVVYPVVVPHPITGIKAILVPELWAASILEMPGVEGDALLQELIAHTTQKKFQYWHQYSVGDMLVWDNWRFLHAAEGTPGEYVRTIWAVSTKAGPQIGRLLSEVSKAA